MAEYNDEMVDHHIDHINSTLDQNYESYAEASGAMEQALISVRDFLETEE